MKLMFEVILLVTANLGAAFEQHGRQRSWPLVHRPEQSPLCGALQCSLQIARSPILVRNALAQLFEPPYTDPYVHGGVGGAEPRGSPYPDRWHKADIQVPPINFRFRG